MICAQYHSEKEQVGAEVRPSCVDNVERDDRDNETEKIPRLLWLCGEPIWKEILLLSNLLDVMRFCTFC